MRTIFVVILSVFVTSSLCGFDVPYVYKRDAFGKEASTCLYNHEVHEETMKRLYYVLDMIRNFIDIGGGALSGFPVGVAVYYSLTTLDSQASRAFSIIPRIGERMPSLIAFPTLGIAGWWTESSKLGEYQPLRLRYDISSFEWWIASKISIENALYTDIVADRSIDSSKLTPGNVSSYEYASQSSLLHQSVNRGHANNVKKLLENEALVSARDIHGVTPLRLSMLRLYEAPEHYQDEWVNCALRLLRHGASPNECVDDAYPHLSSDGGHGVVRYIKLLISHGANLRDYHNADGLLDHIAESASEKKILRNVCYEQYLEKQGALAQDVRQLSRNAAVFCAQTALAHYRTDIVNAIIVNARVLDGEAMAELLLHAYTIQMYHRNNALDEIIKEVLLLKNSNETLLRYTCDQLHQRFISPATFAHMCEMYTLFQVLSDDPELVIPEVYKRVSDMYAHDVHVQENRAYAIVDRVRDG